MSRNLTVTWDQNSSGSLSEQSISEIIKIAIIISIITNAFQLMMS